MRHIGILLLIGMAACQSGQQDAQGTASSEVTLRLDRATYTPGATATMTIRSTSRDTLGYNPCSNRSVERQQGSTWVAHAEPDRMCTMELRLLNPGETQTAPADIPAGLSAGTYRMVLTLSRQRQPRAGETAASGTARAVSATFRVS